MNIIPNQIGIMTGYVSKVYLSNLFPLDGLWSVVRMVTSYTSKLPQAVYSKSQTGCQVSEGVEIREATRLGITDAHFMQLMMAPDGTMNQYEFLD